MYDVTLSDKKDPTKKPITKLTIQYISVIML